MSLVAGLKPSLSVSSEETTSLFCIYSILNMVKHRLHVCLDEEEEQQAAGLQEVVQQVELHRDHVPLPPPGLGSLAQPHHILVLKLRKSGKWSEFVVNAFSARMF